jgi:hypothetical protein
MKVEVTTEEQSKRLLAIVDAIGAVMDKEEDDDISNSALVLVVSLKALQYPDPMDALEHFVEHMPRRRACPYQFRGEKLSPWARRRPDAALGVAV